MKLKASLSWVRRFELGFLWPLLIIGLTSCAEQETVEGDKREEADPEDKGLYLAVEANLNEHGRTTLRSLNFYAELSFKQMKEQEYEVFASESTVTFQVVNLDTKKVVKEEVKAAGSYNWKVDFPSDGSYQVDLVLAHPVDKDITPGEKWSRVVVVDTVAPTYFLNSKVLPDVESGERLLDIQITTQDTDSLSCRVSVLNGKSEPLGIDKTFETSVELSGVSGQISVPNSVFDQHLVLESKCLDKAGLSKAQSIVASASDAVFQLTGVLDTKTHPLGAIEAAGGNENPMQFSSGVLSVLPKLVSGSGAIAAEEFVKRMQSRLKVVVTESPVVSVETMKEDLGYQEFLYADTLEYEARATLLEKKSFYVTLLIADATEAQELKFTAINSSKIEVYFDRVAPQVSFHKDLTLPIEAKKDAELPMYFKVKGSGAAINGPGVLEASVDAQTWVPATVVSSTRIIDQELLAKEAMWKIVYRYGYTDEQPIRFRFVGKDLAGNDFTTEVSPKLVFSNLQESRKNQQGSCKLNDDTEAAGLMMYSASKYYCPVSGNKRAVHLAIENKGTSSLFLESDANLSGLVKAGNSADAYFSVNASLFVEGRAQFFLVEFPEDFATEDSVTAIFDASSEYENDLPKSEYQQRWCHAYDMGIEGRPQISLKEFLVNQEQSPWCDDL